MHELQIQNMNTLQNRDYFTGIPILIEIFISARLKTPFHAQVSRHANILKKTRSTLRDILFFFPYVIKYPPKFPNNSAP
jgi:hypothetical protein